MHFEVAFSVIVIKASDCLLLDGILLLHFVLWRDLLFCLWKLLLLLCWSLFWWKLTKFFMDAVVVASAATHIKPCLINYLLQVVNFDLHNVWGAFSCSLMTNQVNQINRKSQIFSYCIIRTILKRLELLALYLFKWKMKKETPKNQWQSFESTARIFSNQSAFDPRILFLIFLA